MAEELETQDIQGIVVSAYSKLECASYVLLRVVDIVKARQWLAAIAGEVTSAVKPTSTPATNLNLALTAHGLEQFDVPDAVLKTFNYPFLDGMHSERRRRILGDHGDNAPEQWRWGNAAEPVDVILMLYAREDAAIATYEASHADRAAASGFTVVKKLRAGRQPDTKEHFGFNDGVGQPTIAGTGSVKRQQERTGHATPLPAGEFLMSYTDAYGNTAPGPYLESKLDPGSVLPKIDIGGTKYSDLGRNGSYMVFRQLEQDVARFWRFWDEAAGGDPVLREKIAAKFVGRWRSGTPLVTAPDHDTWNPPDPKELNDFNDFGYAGDPHGYACPIGSHVRRTNPRDSLDENREIALMTANRHRLMRRGRSYGHRLSETDPHPMTDDGQERGLHFICFNTDLQRQFEFVQQTWVNNPQFGGLQNEVDPLIGDQSSCSKMMTLQADPLRTRVKNLCGFTTVRGGAYAFLPGIRALKWIASL